MFSKIVNYAIRILMIGLGLAMIIIGSLQSDKFSDSTLVIVMGVIVTLFGIYRLVMYKIQSERYQLNINGDDDE